MIGLNKDKKSETWIITHTDSEGFHKQLQISRDDMNELYEALVVWKFDSYVVEAFLGVR